MRKRLSIALVCGLGAVACAWFYIQSVEARLTGGRLVGVLVAARELPPGTRLDEADLAVRQIPEAYLHPESILASATDEKKILGRPIAVRAVQGQPLLWSDFELQKSKLGRGLSGVVQKGQRAITVAVDLAGSFAGQVRSGDRVDILGTFNRKEHEATVTVLQNVLVLAVGGELDLTDPEKQTVRPNSLTLSLDLEEAELLVFAQQKGPINFVLHGADDVDVVADVGQKSFGDLFELEKRAALSSRRSRARQPKALDPEVTSR
jgi:pilus assembly protein CpaB